MMLLSENLLVQAEYNHVRPMFTHSDQYTNMVIIKYWPSMGGNFRELIAIARYHKEGIMRMLN
jgi:hypothetical protein